MPKDEQQANGANMRNYLIVATEPYREAHFATFGTKWIEPWILAGTSAWGCCEACGAPWVRAVDKEFEKSGPGRDNMGPSSGWTGFPREANRITTTGWHPTCDCAAAVVPCRVLDPFAGSGTTGLVAQRHGRDSILIEINPEYAEMARRRVHAEAGAVAAGRVTQPNERNPNGDEKQPRRVRLPRRRGRR